MSESKKNPNTEEKKINKTDEAEILYQKLGDRWYAFSVIDDEVYIGSIPDAQLDPILKDKTS